MNFASRVNRIRPSQTMAVTAMVAQLRQQGREIIDLGAGEPDFDTPEPVCEAANTAIADGFTKYTPASGILELKEAICQRYRLDYQADFRAQQVVVSSGAKQSVMNCLMALCEKGDEVIVPSPFWTSYLEQVNFVGAKPVILQTDESNQFKIDAEQLVKACNTNTKLLLLNNPCNPTGAVYSGSELRELVDVCREHKFYILSDEIYDKLIYDDHSFESLACYPEIRDRTLLVNGVSKSYAMTGWRIGYLLAEEAVCKAVAKIQSHSTGSPCSISQKAGVAALTSDPGMVETMRVAFDERRKLTWHGLNDLPGFDCQIPEGAFYLFPRITNLLKAGSKKGEINSPQTFCTKLLDAEGIAVVPGEAFNSDQHIRISYAASPDNLERALEKMRRFIENFYDLS